MASVLLAEDDADIRMLVTLKLKQAGHDVRAFADGESALADADENVPDLVILDIVMPGMSGLEVCRHMRGIPATAEVPIIILSARKQLADVTEGLRTGANDYITKPFSPRELAARVEFWLA